jgi:hypothetical protein
MVKLPWTASKRTGSFVNQSVGRRQNPAALSIARTQIASRKPGWSQPNRRQIIYSVSEVLRILFVVGSFFDRAKSIQKTDLTKN